VCGSSVHDPHHVFLSVAHFLQSFFLEVLEPKWQALDLGELLEINANRTVVGGSASSG
jgi:hypothetical protein